MRNVYVTAREGVFLYYDKRRDSRERWKSVRDGDDNAGMMIISYSLCRPRV